MRPYIHRSTKPKRRLLVFDLNGVLLYRKYENMAKADSKADLILNGSSVWVRPGIREFLSRLQRWYDIGIWTSATPDDAHNLVDLVFKQMSFQPLFVLTQADCIPIKIQWPGVRAELKKDVNVLEDKYGYRRGEIIFIDNTIEKMMSLQDYLIVNTWTPAQSSDTELKKIERVLMNALKYSSYHLFPQTGLPHKHHINAFILN